MNYENTIQYAILKKEWQGGKSYIERENKVQ